MGHGETYEEFVEKFKPKKTTDDCYTPEPVYNAVADWVVNEYAVDKEKIVRPFYPGGDYERYNYPVDCVVVDNPPFSILSKIIRFYLDKKIRFFLFAPTLTVFSSTKAECCAVCAGAVVEYENGAKVKTCFVTNLDDSVVRSAPELTTKVIEANSIAKSEKKNGKTIPKYIYANEVLTSTKVTYMSEHGINFRVPFSDAYFIRALDSQKEKQKALFGAGLLLSEKAAAEKAAAEKAAAEKAAAIVWELSDREMEIVRSMRNE